MFWNGRNIKELRATSRLDCDLRLSGRARGYDGVTRAGSRPGRTSIRTLPDSPEAAPFTPPASVTVTPLQLIGAIRRAPIIGDCRMRLAPNPAPSAVADLVSLRAVVSIERTSLLEAHGSRVAG